MKPVPPHQQEPLLVSLRIRPINNTEKKAGAKHITHAVDNKLVILRDPPTNDFLRANRSKERAFLFDGVYNQESTTQDIYSGTVGARGMVDKVLTGYNCTVFAYGATGTGKTHTMLGTDRSPGIMMLMVQELFQKINAFEHEKLATVTMNYLEIYNETVRDLLKPKPQVLDLREDSNGDLVISGLADLPCQSAEEIITNLKKGNQKRTCEPTAANKTSSRSHAIMKLVVEQRKRASNIRQDVFHGVFYMVDLAGSERAAMTQNRGIRMIEGGHINRSLLALANCINALITNTIFINYRDSKLTRLLKEALGGNCTTTMIAHVSPCSTAYEESRSTLTYAERSSHIKNKTRQNVEEVDHHVTMYRDIIDELNDQVEDLEKQLSIPKNKQLSVLLNQLKTLSKADNEIRKDFLTIEYHLLQNAMDSQRHLALIKEWEQHGASISSIPAALSSIDISALPIVCSEPGPVLGVESEEEQFSDDYVDLTASGSSNNEVSVDPDQQEEGGVDNKPHPAKSEHRVSKLDLSLPLPITKTAVTAEEQIKTPDSGADITEDLEPLWLSNAREGLAGLLREKEQMENQHKKLRAKHSAIISSMASVKEQITSSPGLHPAQREVIEMLTKSCDTGAAAVESGLAATLMSVQLGQHEALIDQLLSHSSLLLELITNIQAVLAERGDGLPVGVVTQSKALAHRQRELRAQVLAEKQLPLVSKTIQIPHLAKLSAQLYSTMTGSKSNLSEDPLEDIKEDILNQAQTLSTVQLLSKQQSLQSAPTESLPSTTTLAAVSQIIPSFLQLSTSSLLEKHKESKLPPMDPRKNMTTIASPLATSHIRSASDVVPKQPLADSSLVRILEAAKAKRNDKMENSKGILKKVASFTQPVSKKKYLFRTVTSESESEETENHPKMQTFSPSRTKIRKKLPMDRLVKVVQSKQSSLSSNNNSRFSVRNNKASGTSVMLPVSSRDSQTMHHSITSLHADKKLVRGGRPKPSKKVLPMTTTQVHNKFINSPYHQPQLRTVIPRPQGAKKSSTSQRRQIKHLQAWK